MGIFPKASKGIGKKTAKKKKSIKQTWKEFRRMNMEKETNF